MKYYVVTNGTEWGTLEQGKPMPFNFHVTGEGKLYSKEEAQAWYDETMYYYELLGARK